MLTADFAFVIAHQIFVSYDLLFKTFLLRCISVDLELEFLTIRLNTPYNIEKGRKLTYRRLRAAGQIGGFKMN